jgi:hypothetical protein
VSTTTVTSSSQSASTSSDTIATSSADIATGSKTTVDSSPQSALTPPPESAAQPLTEVHIIGKKYVDYFTDGTTLTSFPGDSKVDSNLDQPNAPPPAHEGLAWDHTATQFLYDTPSGDLDPGDYAQMPSGGYIAHYPSTVYTDATSSVSQSDRITTSPSVPTWDHLAPGSSNNATTSTPQNTTPLSPADVPSSTSDTDNSSSANSSPPTNPTESPTTTDTAATSTSL